MFKRVVKRIALPLLLVGTCAFVAGCLSGPSYFPFLLPSGAAVQTHPKPVGPGYFADFDPHAHRIELRPGVCTAPIRGTQVFIATVYDRDGVPRRARRVEWMLEGAGNIVEVDESGLLHGRGMKVDNKFGFSQTDYFEHCLTRGQDEFTIGPGQTWCVVSSAVMGETTLTAYVPAIADWNRNRAYAKIHWTEAGLIFPAPVTARAGGRSTLTTRVSKDGGIPEGFRVRYRISDGPAAALTMSGTGPVESVREAVTTVSEDGSSQVTIAQPLPAVGKTRVAIELVKPSADDPSKFTVVSAGETTVTWQEVDVGVRISAPRTLALNQDAMVTYEIGDLAKVGTESITFTAQIPAGMNLIRTEPRAAVDGTTLIWTIPTSSKSQSVEAVLRPAKVGPATLTAEARTKNGIVGRGKTEVSVTEAKLLVKLEGPKSGAVGEALPFQITVTNSGSALAEKVRVQARFSEGLETASKAKTLDETIESLAAGKSRTIPLPLSATTGGKFLVEAGATGADSLVAIPQSITIDVQKPQLGLTAHSPPRAYVGDEVLWQLVVRNTGEVALDRIMVKATLPPEVSFVKATDGGKANGKEIQWDLGTAPARGDRTVAVTVRCERLAEKSTLSATASGTPAGSSIKPTTLIKPATATLEIVGVPALQMTVVDSADPIGIGQKATYTIRVKNAGTKAATNVDVSAVIPNNMKPIRASGPGPQGKIDKQMISFAPIATLAPNAEATFVIEIEALVPGSERFRAEVRSPTLSQPIRTEEPTRVLERVSRPGGGDY